MAGIHFWKRPWLDGAEEHYKEDIERDEAWIGHEDEEQLPEPPALPERGEDGWIDQYYEDTVSDPPF